MKLKVYLLLGFFLLSIGGIIAIETSTPSEVNINIFRFIYSNYDSSTTNFDSLNQSEVMNASGIILENSLYGRIEFLENLNLFDMKDISWTVDFNKNLNISDNLINVDESLLPGINKSAMLYFYNINLTTPVIYNKGVICVDCVEDNYLNGVYSFSTPFFEGPYYLREAVVAPFCGDNICNNGETEVSCPTDCSTGGGSGGGGSGGGGSGGTTGGGSGGTSENATEIGDYNFTIYPTLIEATVRKGSYFQKKVTVENTGTQELTIAIIVDNLAEYVFPEVKSFIIKPGEIKEIRIDLYVGNNVASDAYLGKINFISRYVSRTANFVLLVNNKDALFDLRTTVLKKYVNPGGRARANISLINMGDLRNFDVNLEYKILDFERNEYSIKKEQFAINTTHDGVYFLDTPVDMPIGNYIFYSTVSYKNINATSYDTFSIEKISYLSWLILIIIILILIYLVIRWYKQRKRELLEEEMRRRLKPKKKGIKINRIPIEKEVPLLP